MNEMTLYFGARGVVDLLLLLSNGLLATVIALILVFAQPKGGGSLDLHARLSRYAFVAVYGVLAARVWCGLYYTPVEPTEVAVNVIVMWLVWITRGDISAILDAVRVVLDRRAHS